MYDVMIVDDDANIRERIKNMVNWDEMELNLVCEAEDSDMSLELFKIHSPSIVIIDINIPTVSGIIIAEEMIRQNPDVKVIMITGYSDIKYARDSIKVGAIDLILKPIDPDEIKQTLMKTIELFKKQKEEKANSENIKKILQESLPILREKFLQNLLSGSSVITEERAIERLKALATDILGSSYCIAVVVPDIHKISNEKTDFILVTVQNTVNELLSDANFKVFSYYDPLYRLICIISNERNGYLQIIESIISSSRDNLRFYHELDIHAGIGYETNSISCLYNSFESALEAINYRGVFGQNNVVNINNVIQIDKVDMMQNVSSLRCAINSFKTGDVDIVLAELDKYVKSLITTSLGNIEMIKKIYLEYVSATFRYCSNQGITIEEIKEADVFYKIFTFNDFIHIKQYVAGICVTIVNTINLKRKSRKNIIIENAKKFINDNICNENLGLKMASEYLGLSNIYFSQLFHKEQNMSFNDYINEVRVEKAKELLKTTNLKVYEIAYEVGYQNPKYFNYIFKKHSGISPSEFKNI